jgi:hypothetical protein
MFFSAMAERRTIFVEAEICWADNVFMAEWIYFLHPPRENFAARVTIFEAPDEAAAQKIVDEDPTIAAGFARGELRPFRVSLLRGRD